MRFRKHKQRSEEQKAEEESLQSLLNEDELDIISYIGGYIIMKLKKKAKTKEEHHILDQLESQENFATNYSLINTFQIHEYGNLIKPSCTLIKILAHLEQQFREHSGLEEIVQNTIKNINIADIFPLCLDWDKTAYALENICKLYFKVRAYQKARLLKNQVVAKPVFKNVSLRKSLR